MHLRAQCHATWPRRCRAFQHPSRIEPKSPNSLLTVLTTKPLVHINNREKLIHESSYFATCNHFFCIQDCRTQIVLVEYHGQTQNTRILELKTLIDVFYRIQHRLGLKYFHFAQFLLNAHRAAQSTLVTTWLSESNIAFHLRPIWLQTLVEINSESRLT